MWPFGNNLTTAANIIKDCASNISYDPGKHMLKVHIPGSSLKFSAALDTKLRESLMSLGRKHGTDFMVAFPSPRSKEEYQGGTDIMLTGAAVDELAAKLPQVNNKVETVKLKAKKAAETVAAATTTPAEGEAPDVLPPQHPLNRFSKETLDLATWDTATIGGKQMLAVTIDRSVDNMASLLKSIQMVCDVTGEKPQATIKDDTIRMSISGKAAEQIIHAVTEKKVPFNKSKSAEKAAPAAKPKEVPVADIPAAPPKLPPKPAAAAATAIPPALPQKPAVAVKSPAVPKKPEFDPIKDTPPNATGETQPMPKLAPGGFNLSEFFQKQRVHYRTSERQAKIEGGKLVTAFLLDVSPSYAAIVEAALVKRNVQIHQRIEPGPDAKPTAFIRFALTDPDSITQVKQRLPQIERS